MYTAIFADIVKVTEAVSAYRIAMEEQEEAESNKYGWQDEVQVMSDVHFGCPPEDPSCTTIFSIAQPIPAAGGRCLITFQLRNW